MLCSFSVKNYRGFKDKVTLDLTSSDYKFNNECIKDGYANKALIYGYNGVGKSNLGLAIMDIITNLTDKEKTLLLDSNYRNAETDNNIIEFEYIFKFQEIIIKYQYGKKTPEHIVFEYLYINEKKILSYNRTLEEPLIINLHGTETLLKDINKIQISVLKYIKSNTALDESPETYAIKSFFSFVDGMLLFRNLLDEKKYVGYVVGGWRIFDDIINKNHFQDFIDFLASARVPNNIEFKKIGEQHEVFFSYETESKRKNEIDFFKYSSTGMKTLSLLFFWLQKTGNDNIPPSFIFIDEFDAFYHQELSEFVIKEIKKFNNCQIILTTHDTGVMSNDIMRPDCLFLMYKDKIRSLSNSTRKELRSAHNIEKMYRAGAFDE